MAGTLNYEMIMLMKKKMMVMMMIDLLEFGDPNLP